MKGWKRGLLAAVLLVFPVLLLARMGMNSSYLNMMLRGEGFAYRAEGSVRLMFPFQSRLRQAGMSLGLLGGQGEQNGVFISRKGLMKNIDPPTEPYVQSNIQAILTLSDYASEVGVPVHLVLIPTASAILQDNLPRFADTYNQRQFIEETYSRMYGRVSTVDVYTTLLSHRDQYLYYRTENNLTATGGYYVYSVLGERLNVGVRELDQFDISFAEDDYYGDLYQLLPYRDVQPDVLSLYRYHGAQRSGYARKEYLVTHTQDGVRRTYHTLYPDHAAQLGGSMDIYLGGTSAVTTVETASPEQRRLLIFGDKTARTYLPFLCNHYRQITLVDLFQDSSNFGDIYLEDYDQVLFAYGVESFISYNSPSRASMFALDY